MLVVRLVSLPSLNGQGVLAVSQMEHDPSAFRISRCLAARSQATARAQ